MQLKRHFEHQVTNRSFFNTYLAYALRHAFSSIEVSFSVWGNHVAIRADVMSSLQHPGIIRPDLRRVGEPQARWISYTCQIEKAMVDHKLILSYHGHSQHSSDDLPHGVFKTLSHKQSMQLSSSINDQSRLAKSVFILGWRRLPSHVNNIILLISLYG